MKLTTSIHSPKQIRWSIEIEDDEHVSPGKVTVVVTFHGLSPRRQLNSIHFQDEEREREREREREEASSTAAAGATAAAAL